MMKRLLFVFTFAALPAAIAMEGEKCASVTRVKVTATLPKLIIFDFHGTLSLDTTGSKKISMLKDRLKKYNNNEFKAPLTVDNWHTLMNRATAHNDLKVEDVVPRAADLIGFVDVITRESKNATKFAIASNLEQDSFIIAMMRYVFENKGKREINPFNENAVVGTQGLTKYGQMPAGDGKLKHIAILLKNFGLEMGKDIQYSDMVLIDNSGDDLAKVRGAGVRPIQVQEYFRVQEWNDQYK